MDDDGSASGPLESRLSLEIKGELEVAEFAGTAIAVPGPGAIRGGRSGRTLGFLRDARGDDWSEDD